MDTLGTLSCLLPASLWARLLPCCPGMMCRRMVLQHSGTPQGLGPVCGGMHGWLDPVGVMKLRGSPCLVLRGLEAPLVAAVIRRAVAEARCIVWAAKLPVGPAWVPSSMGSVLQLLRAQACWVLTMLRLMLRLMLLLRLMVQA